MQIFILLLPYPALFLRHRASVVDRFQRYLLLFSFFFFNDPATTEIYTLSLHDALPILIWLDLVASLPLIKERILVIILLLHFLSLMLGSVLVLMLPLLVWLTPDLRIKKSLLKCNWTIRKRLPRCKMR